MENAVYWNGVQVGIEVDGRIFWYASTPQAAIDAYSGRGDDKPQAGSHANLNVVAAIPDAGIGRRS